MLRYIILASVIAIHALTAMGADQSAGPAFTLKVRHEHLRGHCEGDLVLFADRIEYRTANKKDARVWPYKEIQVLEIPSPSRMRVYTYEDRPRLMGYDKKFTFEVAGGEVGQAISDYLRDRIGKPFVTSYTAENASPEAAVPVKHLHRFGGCQGTLKVFADHLVFDADKKEDSRSWRWSDIRGISRLDEFRLEVLTYEPELGSPGRSYEFVLKERLDEATYDSIWRRVYPARRFNAMADALGNSHETITGQPGKGVQE